VKVVEVERELDGRGVSDVGQWSSTIDCLLDLYVSKLQLSSPVFIMPGILGRNVNATPRVPEPCPARYVGTVPALGIQLLRRRAPSPVFHSTLLIPPISLLLLLF